MRLACTGPAACTGAELRLCVQEHVAYSLELSAMRRCLDAAQRAAIAQTAVAALTAAAPLLDLPGALRQLMSGGCPGLGLS